MTDWDSEKLRSVFEMAGAAAVLLGLIFVGLELKQKAAMSAQAVFQLNDSADESHRLVAYDSNQQLGVASELPDMDSNETVDANFVGSRITATTIPATVMVEDGYVDPAGTYSDYASYDTATIIQIAEAGDRRALLEAAIRGSIPFEERQHYALLAAEQGYTSALLRVGMAVLAGPPPGTDPNAIGDPPDPTTGVALIIAAQQLGDSGANESNVWDIVKVRVSEKQIRDAENKAQEILRDLQAK